MKYNPENVVVTFVNEDRTRGFMLQANGKLVENHRESPSDMWSPPEMVASAVDIAPGIALDGDHSAADANLAKLRQLVQDADARSVQKEPDDNGYWAGMRDGLRRAITVLEGRG
jgi:hypothetical protein